MKEYKVLYLDLDGPIEETLNEQAKARWVLIKIIPPTDAGHLTTFFMEREAWNGDSIYRRGDEPIPGEKLMGY